MALNAKTAPKSGGNFVEQNSLDAGLYPARVVQIIDLGLQPQRAFQGKEKPPAHTMMINYELSHEFMSDENGDPIADKPRWFSEDFVLHNIDADRAKSTRRINTLDPRNDVDGDFSKLGGFPCQVMLTKVPDPKNAGKFKNYVNDVSAAPKMPGYVQPELINPINVFLLDDPDLEVFAKLPEWLREKITSNLEYKGSVLEAKLNGHKPAPAAAPTPQPTPSGPRPVPPAPKRV